LLLYLRDDRNGVINKAAFEEWEMTWAGQQAQISRLFYSVIQKSIKILATEHPIIIIIIVFIILGYFHSIITPLFVKPDEEWHFAYIAHIRQTGSLPTAMERTK
jgi:hypothetical protein